LEPYDLIVIAVPRTTASRSEWNDALRNSGFVQLRAEYYVELVDPDSGWPTVLGREFRREESDLWEKTRPA